MRTTFSANLNKVALLRNTRDRDLPNLERAAEIALEAGADGLTLHPRPDRRHATPEDVRSLRRITAAAQRELNVEGYPSAEFLDLVCAVRPDQCTLVPDAPGQRTSDHGFDCRADAALLHGAVARLRQAGIRVSLFLDPDPAQVDAAAATGAQRIELYTERWSRAYSAGAPAPVLDRFRATALAAQAAGLGVNAGHDLDLLNLGAFLSGVPDVREVSIGHALIADALELGLAEAVRRYVAICAGSTPGSPDAGRGTTATLRA